MLQQNFVLDILPKKEESFGEMEKQRVLHAKNVKPKTRELCLFCPKVQLPTNEI